MNPGKTTPNAPATQQALIRSLRAFVQMLPILLGMLLLTSLIFAWLLAELRDKGMRLNSIAPGRSTNTSR